MFALRLLPLLLIGALASCGAEVNCEALCTRTLLCEVTFAPRDDIEGAKIASGERTVEEACALGCADQPAVTPDSARCVDDITNVNQDPVTCQDPVLACFGIAAEPTQTGTDP